MYKHTFLLVVWDQTHNDGFTLTLKMLAFPLSVILVDFLLCKEVIENWLKPLGIYDQQIIGPKLLG